MVAMMPMMVMACCTLVMLNDEDCGTRPIDKGAVTLLDRVLLAERTPLSRARLPFPGEILLRLGDVPVLCAYKVTVVCRSTCLKW